MNAKASSLRVEDNRNEEGLPRPASLIALESQFSKEQVEILRHVAVLLAASALKIARENGILQ